MSDQNHSGLRKISRALISVSDKTGIVDFARALKTSDVEIISTGGTAKALRESGIKVTDVSDITGFPEMMDGRVKTLHPKIHGGLLAVRDNPEHVAAMNQNGIEPIDMVVIDLYPFEQTVRREGVTEAEAIEQIDIGGPAMIRSAAKNTQDVAVIVLPKHFASVLDEMKNNDGSLSLNTRNALAQEAFGQTSRYDMIVTAYLTRAFEHKSQERGGIGAAAGGGSDTTNVFRLAPGGIEVPPPPRSIEELKSLPD